MCLDLEWRHGFLPTAMALVLSQNKGTLSGNSNPKSLKVGATASSSDKLGFYGGKGYPSLFAGGP